MESLNRGFHRQGTVAVSLTGGSQLIINEQLSTTRKLIIRKLGTYLSESDAWSLITWELLRNGIPVFPYDSMIDQVGLQYQPLELGEPVEFAPGDIVGVRVTSSDAVNPGTEYHPGIILIGEYV